MGKEHISEKISQVITLSPPSDATPPLLRPSGESKAIPSGKVLELLPGVLQ